MSSLVSVGFRLQLSRGWNNSQSWAPSRRRATTCVLRSCSSGRASDDLPNRFLSVMRVVPSPVAVVTSGERVAEGGPSTLMRRGATCSSFTSVSLNPPIVSFCLQQPSRLHQLLLSARKFAVHVLSETQAHYSAHFAQRDSDSSADQFSIIPHVTSEEGIPIIPNCSAVLTCAAEDVHSIGDHSVWYGRVRETVQNNVSPLLYYARTYRSVGDETFMRAFEDVTLACEDWTHQAHLRMAWNYIVEHGKEEATPLIKNGIRRYIEKSRGKVKNVYHETITMFFVHMISSAIDKFNGRSHNFEELLSSSPHLTDSRLLYRHYSHQRLNSREAREKWLPPDILNLASS